jgi:hypothetical protein
MNSSNSSSSNQLRDRLSQVLIIAYKEPTDRLEKFFAQQGLKCEVLRQEDNPAYKDYASIYRCMLNHSRGWARAAEETQPTMIVEADYVPVINLGELPLPFNGDRDPVGICWLYTCAPQIYSVTEEGFGEGFSTALVAYILTPEGARALGGLVDKITAEQGTGYFNFDSEIDNFLRPQGFKNYIPLRNYGEHGGIANPEHRKNGMSGIHRADVLANRLAFLPDYAAAEPNSSLALLKARLNARIKGMARLVLGKFLRIPVVSTSSYPVRLIKFAILRQLSLH